MHLLRRTNLAYRPEYIALEVTNVCNFKCDFCPQSDPAHHDIVPRTYLDPTVCASYLEKIRAAGILTNLMHWTLDGEPFMHKEFSRLVEVSADYGFTNTYFASNGMLCSVERLMDFPLDRVHLNLAIDFCTDKDYFEKVRGTKNSWDTVCNNIQDILRDSRMANVNIEITDISSYSENDTKKLADNFQNLQDVFGEHDRVKYRTRTFHNATGLVENNREKRGTYHICPYPWTHLRIASNGDIVACCRDLQHKTVLGNLNLQSVNEIWNGEPFQNLRHSLLDKRPNRVNACRGCDLPFDDSKFTIKNVYRAARGRMQLFAK